MLQIEERIQVVSILANMYEFAGGNARDRRGLMQNAGLNRFILGIDLSGSPKIVASDLVGRLENYGHLPEQPTYHALGALFSYMLNTLIGELTPKDAAFIAALVIKYRLVNDINYLNTLRNQYPNQYSVSVETPRQSPYLIATSDPTFEVAFRDEKQIEVLEKVIDDESNLLDIHPLVGALYSAQAVCRIEIPEGQARGTGFLIGPDLVLTNKHVLKNQDDVREAVARFGFLTDINGVSDIKQSRVFQLQPHFYFSSSIEVLDYALVKLTEQPLKQVMVGSQNDSMLDHLRRGSHVGYLPVGSRTIRENDRVNIIQHPGGHPMKVVMTHNYVIEDMKNSRVQYLADTQSGSSGSPVFNKNWEVVALHHSSQFSMPSSLKAAFENLTKRRPFIVNEGIPIKAILEDFKTQGIDRHLPRK